MKRFVLTGLLAVLTFLPVTANELTEDYFDMAVNYCIEGKYGEASEYLDKILTAEPQNKSVADLKNGLNQIIQGKNTSYILPKSNAVKQAVSAKLSGNKQSELSALTGGSDYQAYYFLGEYYKENKDYSQAVNWFVKSVNSKPNFTQCYLEIAVCYFEMKNFRQAVTYLNQYLKLNPQDDFAYALRARSNANLKSNEEALNDIIAATAIENSVDYRFLEGKILYNMKSYPQAREKLAALTDDIQTAELYKYLGLCDAELGNYTDALLNLEKSIILFDDDRTVNSKYNEVKAQIGN